MDWHKNMDTQKLWLILFFNETLNGFVLNSAACTVKQRYSGQLEVN